MNVILSTKNLSFLNKIQYCDMEVVQGSIVFVCGPSGCGKSSLFRLLNATNPSEEDQIFFHGQDICHLDKVKLRRKILLTGQSPYLFRGSIADNFSIYHEYQDSVPPGAKDMEECLQICCADFQLPATCDTMSGGERQRVFLAVALSLRPEVLLLDEPTSALDSALSFRILEQIIAHCRKNGITLLVISHDGLLREKYAEKTVELEGAGSYA